MRTMPPTRPHPLSSPAPAFRSGGFTLIEMIMVITITGIIAGMIAVFIKAPIDSYFDTARRVELSDMADTAVRRIARDVHLALPNSMRNPTDGSDQCVEFMPTKSGGRYRHRPDSASNGDVLDITTTDASFDMFWLNSTLPAASQIVAGDVVVVYNNDDGTVDGPGKADCSGTIDAGTVNGNAYCGYNAIQIQGLAEPGGTANSTAISFVGTGAAVPFNRKRLLFNSLDYRFQVVPAGEHVVAYACSGGTLFRYRRALTAAWVRPADCAAMAAGATAAVLAQNISACSLKYEPPGPGSSNVLSNNGILAISLQITQSDESVRIYHQVHVDNTP